MSISQDSMWLLKEKYDGVKSDAFYADVKRLAMGEPLGYIIGHVPFLNTTIHLDSRPLIPRAETEFWVEKAIDEIKSKNIPSPHILDLCAGSGCIGVSVAKKIPSAQVDFSEIEIDHIETIKKNLTENDIPENHYNVVHTSLFDKLPTKYNFILSNPPYIDETLNRVDHSVIDFEPHLALFGGQDGMEVITNIIEKAINHLHPQGQLWMEHEPEQTEIITELAEKNLYTITTHRDQYGTERYSKLVYDLNFKES